MNFISLFSGIGGFDLGFERSGMTSVSVCEINKNAQDVLKKHFPHATLFDDVRTIGVNTHGRKSVDLICGGFPCQDLSIAGKRAGLAGERSGLWFEFARIIDELEPRWVVIENVPGLLSSNRGRDFAVILQWLVKRGYGVSWRVLDAQYFGVPQRRRRVFVVASFGSGRSAEVLFERESGEWNPPTRREAGKDAAETFTVRSGKDGGGKGYLGAKSLPMTLGGQDQYLAKTITTCEAQSMDSETMKFIVSQPLVFDGAQITSKQHGSLPSKISQPLNTLGQMSVIAWEMQHASEAYRESGSVAPTLQARMGTGGNNVPMVGVRRLTPLECERLQGFPDGWTDGQSNAQRYKQLGNAVAVPVIEWIGKRIMEVL